MHSERVDGFNPLAVADAVARKKKILLSGEGPVFMETITYRITAPSVGCFFLQNQRGD